MASSALRSASWAVELRAFSSSGVRRAPILFRSFAPTRQPWNPQQHTEKSTFQNISQLRTFVSPSNARQAENNNTTNSSSSASKPASTTTSKPASSTSNSTAPQVQNISKTGLDDNPSSEFDVDSLSPNGGNENGYVDWTRSYHGLSSQPFSPEAAAILLEPIKDEDIEIKPDGIVYLPEIKYRRILNRAFGPGGWGLVPRSESIVTAKAVTREYALVAHGRLVSIARGEQDYFNPEGIPTATEGCKSNAMMRCCKDLGVASELWDPRWIRKFKANHCREAFVEHIITKRKSKIWTRKGDELQYPWKTSTSTGSR